MRHLVLDAPHHLTWQQAANPELSGPATALVRPIAVATCDFDHLMVGGHAPLPMPIAIGHECVAEVVAVGGDVRNIAPGDVVAVPFQIACGRCAPCRRGRTSSCAAVPWLSCYGLGPLSGDWGGAMADLLAVPYADAMLVALPAGVTPVDAASASCNLPDAYRCVGPQLRDHPGADVLIVGGAFGNIALQAVALARALGASRVDYLDRDPARAARAAALGARVVPTAADVESALYPITVDAAQDAELLAVALQATAPAGTCTLSVMYPEPPSGLPLMTAFERCLTIRTGQPDVRAHLDTVLGLIADGIIRPADVTDAVVDWDDAPEAFAAGSGKRVCVRR